MYYDYFNLNQPPFKITPDTSLFFPGGDRGAILDALIYAIVSGEGIVKLVGEVGSGKTTLCRMLEKELPENIEVVYLANPSLSPDNILHAIAFELHLKVRPNDTRLKVMNSLQNYLLERHAENKQIVVFVEEAQSMPIATLEEIRLLSNLETAQNKLLQIVIFGQPELDTMISKQEIRQLKERITYSFYLDPLKQQEVKDYINSRLRACGYRSVELFNDKAIKATFKYSGGLLRRINILADKSLLACYAANASTVTAKHVELASRETEFVSKKQWSVFQWSLASFAVLVIAILAFNLNAIKQTVLSTEKAIVSDATKDDGNEDKRISSKSMASSLMLIEDAREDINKTKKHQDSIQKLPVNNTEKTTSFIANDSETVVDVTTKADSITLQVPDWKDKKQDVYFYPDKEDKVLDADEDIRNSELLEIRDLIKAVNEHGNEEEIALLNQLTILPSETAINHGSVATDLTCKLCSTIIYRPLKNGKNL